MKSRTGLLADRGWRPRAGRSAAVGMLILLAACGDGMEGTYQDELGVMRYDFKGDGHVALTVMGATVDGEYEVNGDQITVIGPHGRIGLRRDGEVLTGPMGLVLTPVTEN